MDDITFRKAKKLREKISTLQYSHFKLESLKGAVHENHSLVFECLLTSAYLNLIPDSDKQEILDLAIKKVSERIKIYTEQLDAL